MAGFVIGKNICFRSAGTFYILNSDNDSSIGKLTAFTTFFLVKYDNFENILTTIF